MARVLVVDKDHATVGAMARLLRQDGHDVYPFTSGADALGTLSRQSFDAVVVDVDIPHGELVVRAARERSPAACLVAVTLKAAMDAEWTEPGVCAVVEKPIDYDRLAETLADCHGRAGRRGRCNIQSQVERPVLTQLRCL